MVQAVLNAVCEDFQGCHTIAYADLSTQLILATNTKTELSRDTLNALCAQANLALAKGSVGVIGTQAGFQVFLRATAEPNDALICLCSLQTDMVRFLPAAQACLAAIASTDATP